MILIVAILRHYPCTEGRVCSRGGALIACVRWSPAALFIVAETAPHTCRIPVLESRLDQYEMNRTNSLGRGGRERSQEVYETLNVSREFQRVIERPGHA